jgi:hypothetical protein
MFFQRKVKVCLLALLLPVFAVSAKEELVTGLVIPDIPEGEELNYRVIYEEEKEEKDFALDGELSSIQDFTYSLHKYEENGKNYFEVTETERLGKGMHNDFVTIFEAGPYLRMLRYTNSVYSYTGTMIRQTYADFDDPVLEVPGPTITTHVITYWLRGVDFKPGHAAEFYLRLLGDAAPPWRMHARVGEKIEVVEVPAGRFECYKVTIDPDFAHFFGKWAWISFIIRPLVPDFYVWYDVEAPHPMVKFEGALGISGITAIETHELVSRTVP